MNHSDRIPRRSRNRGKFLAHIERWQAQLGLPISDRPAAA
jgi:hypothetical protein